MPQTIRLQFTIAYFIRNQIETAKKYNFKGFGCCHYWFSESDDKDNMIMRKLLINYLK